MQVLQDKLSEMSFRAEEKICTREGALGHLMATSLEQLLQVCRDMFSMPPKPGFLLQDTWDEMVLWVRTVGKMGLMEALNRLGRCVYNRWRLLHTAGARPGMQAESPGGAPKGPKERKASIARCI
ncbi:hypothetical protein TRVL_10319 [Trypanosoma vivax]|nr:hypothetical protein TRVL_10319 [Trypanosoma vivax]